MITIQHFHASGIVGTRLCSVRAPFKRPDKFLSSQRVANVLAKMSNAAEHDAGADLTQM